MLVSPQLILLFGQSVVVESSKLNINFTILAVNSHTAKHYYRHVPNISIFTNITSSHVQIHEQVIRERGSVLYLGMAQEFWDFAKLAYQTAIIIPALRRDLHSFDHHCIIFKRTFEHAGGKKKIGLNGHFSLSSYNRQTPPRTADRSGS